VIDEAQTRRGVPSVNARWSNIVAILAGDFLLARASDLAASLGADVAGLLARTIGELCRGQVQELHHLFDADRPEGAYLSAIAGKTAALFATSCRIGGMVSGLDAPGLDALDRFGHHLGMCFQIVDDILDVAGSTDDLGKPAGNDLLEGVYTLPVIYAVDRRPELRDLLGSRLDDPGLARALEAVRAGGAIDDATGVARDHATKAVEALRGASDGFDPSVVGSPHPPGRRPRRPAVLSRSTVARKGPWGVGRAPQAVRAVRGCSCPRPSASPPILRRSRPTPGTRGRRRCRRWALRP